MGGGANVSTGDTILASKMNLKIEDDGSPLTGRTFLVNGFQFPSIAGTDWIPSLKGAYLGPSATGSAAGGQFCWLPLNFLKLGDIITGFKLLGELIENAAILLDAKLVRINLADPITTTDIGNGAIAQQDADGDFDVAATVDDETVITDSQYVIQIAGTTGALDYITVMGAEVAVSRIV